MKNRRNERHVAVDRIEGLTVVLIDDDDREFEVQRQQLPLRRISEGDILQVKCSDRGVPNWATAVSDPEEKRRRLAEARATLDQLKRSDPGGDLSL